jgi:hypothetical protein
MSQRYEHTVLDDTVVRPSGIRKAGIAAAVVMGVSAIVAVICFTIGHSRSSAPSDEMTRALARTPAPMDIDAVLGGPSSGSALIRKDGHVPLEQLLAPRR